MFVFLDVRKLSENLGSLAEKVSKACNIILPQHL